MTSHGHNPKNTTPPTIINRLHTLPPPLAIQAETVKKKKTQKMRH